jgi:hypothetical protein
MVHIGLLLSPSLKAQTLLMLDLQGRSVLFFQNSETIEDLNPVFQEPSMTPFCWTESRTGNQHTIAVYRKNKKLCSMITIRLAPNSNTRVATIVREGDDVPDGFWQCDLTNEIGDDEVNTIVVVVVVALLTKSCWLDSRRRIMERNTSFHSTWS